MSNNLFRILIIEDDSDISNLIKLQLQLKEYQVQIVENGAQAMECMQKENFDLFIIDRMLPDTNGLELCGRIRASSEFGNRPIILVTALADSQNIIEGLEAGADDYITKPFDINVLYARVKAQLRRYKNGPVLNEVLRFDSLELNIQKCRVRVNSQDVALTNTEFQILTTLAQQPGIVQSRQKLISQVIGTDVHVTNRTIDTHIAGLRKKLGVAANLIETIRGVGYRFHEFE